MTLKRNQVLSTATTLVVVGLFVASIPTYAYIDNPFDNPGDSENSGTIFYDHWSVLAVVETITDIGGGTWKYSYEFTNTETDYIWLFWVYTTFYTSAPTTFVEKPNWVIDIYDIEYVHPIFDARNLDSGITQLIGAYPADWTWQGTTADPIYIDMTVSGFSFQANVYDPRPKYYGYELHGNYGAVTGNVSAVGLTVPMAIPATIDVDPDSLNLKSKGKWIACYIKLPEGYNVSDIDVSTIMLNDTVAAELHPTEIGDYDADGITDLMVKFNRKDLIGILGVGETTLTITGEVNDTSFEGSDTIRVTEE